jgi:hypothetical protein
MKEDKFIIKTVINVLFLIIFTVMIVLVFNNTLFTIDISLGQMMNSDEAYMIMEYYNKIRSISLVVYGIVSTFLIWNTIKNIYIYVKNRGEN